MRRVGTTKSGDAEGRPWRLACHRLGGLLEGARALSGVAPQPAPPRPWRPGGGRVRAWGGNAGWLHR